jgi:hypothetical protein
VAYSGSHRLIEAARLKGVPAKQTLEWLRKLPAWSRHKPVQPIRRNFDPRASKINDLWHMDTFFLPKDGHREGFNAYLISVDALSRFVRVKKLDRVRSTSAKKALLSMIRDAKCKPVIIVTDDGSEFKGEFQRELKKLNIRGNVARGASKAYFAERYIKEIKARLYRRSTFLGEKLFNDAVFQTVKNINESKNSTTRLAPSAVRPKHAWQIWKSSVVAHLSQRSVKPKYARGDIVRLSYDRSKGFRRGVLPTYGSEKFVIDRVFPARPHYMYSLQDLNSEKILGSFYESELQKVYEKNGE